MKTKFFQTATLSLACSGLISVPAFANDALDDEGSTTDVQAVAEEIDDVAASLGATSDDPAFEAHKRKKNKDKSALRAKIKEVCAKVNVTADQKGAVGASMLDYKRDMIMLTAEKKVAKLNYLASLVKSDAQRAEAEAAGTALTEVGTKISTKKVDFANELFFDILKQEQRGPALKCIALIKKAHKHWGHSH